MATYDPIKRKLTTRVTLVPELTSPGGGSRIPFVRALCQKITRNWCQTSAGTVSTIRWSRSVQHHPEHDSQTWVARESTPEPTD